MAANGLLRGVLARIKQRLQGQLLADYQQWLAQQNDNLVTQASPTAEALEAI